MGCLSGKIDNRTVAVTKYLPLSVCVSLSPIHKRNVTRKKSDECHTLLFIPVSCTAF